MEGTQEQRVRGLPIRYNKKDIFLEDSLFKKIWDNPDTLVYSEKEIISILEGFNKYLSKVVTSIREGVAMPLHMGVMVSGTWGDKPVKDISTSVRLQKEVTYKNYHSDGYGGRIYYITEMTKSRFALGKFWGFIPVDEMSRNLRDGYLKDWKLYANIPNSKGAYKIYKKAKAKQFAAGMTEENMKAYDEFDFD